MRTKHFYLKVLSAFLACAMLVVSSCTDYDDDIYDINARLDSLESVTKDLPSLDAQVQVLQGISDQLEWIINYDGVGLEAKIDALLDTGSSVWADFITDLEAYYVTLEKYNTEIADYYKSADLEGDLDEYWKTNFTATNILAILEAAEISDQLYELVKTPVTDAIDDAIDAIKAEDIDGIDDVIQNFLDTLVFEDLAGDGVDVTGLTQAINALNNAYKDLNTSLSDDITQVSDDLSDLSDLVNAYTIFNDENTGLETVVSLKNVYEAIYNDATGIAAVWSAIDALEDLVGGIDVAELSALVGDVDVVALKASFDTLFDSYDAIDDTLYAFFVNKDEETGMTGLESLQDTIVLYDEIVDMIDDAVSGLREELYGTDEEMGSIASIIEGYLTYNCCSEEWATFTSAVETYLYEVLSIESFDDVFTVNNIDVYLATYLEGIKNTTEANLMTQLNSLITENLQDFIDKVNGQITDLYAKYQLAQDQIDLILSGIQTISFVPTNTANTIPVNVVDTYTFIYANILDNGDGYEREIISKPISAKNTFTAKYLVQPISVAATLVEEFKSNPERFSIYEEKVSKSCSTKFEVTDVQLVCCSCCGSEKDGQIIVTIEAQDGVFSSLTEAEAYMIAFSYTGAPVTDGNENGISVASSYNELVESEISSENVNIRLAAGIESAEALDDTTYEYVRSLVRTIVYDIDPDNKFTVAVPFSASADTKKDVTSYVLVDEDGSVGLEDIEKTVVPLFEVEGVLYTYAELDLLLADAIEIGDYKPASSAVKFEFAKVNGEAAPSTVFSQADGVMTFADSNPNYENIGEVAYLVDLTLLFNEGGYYATNSFALGTADYPIIDVTEDKVTINGADATHTWNYSIRDMYYNTNGESDNELALTTEAGDIFFTNILGALDTDAAAALDALVDGTLNTDYSNIVFEIYGADGTVLFSYVEDDIEFDFADGIKVTVDGGAALFTNGVAAEGETVDDGKATYSYMMQVYGVTDGYLYTVNGDLTTQFLPKTISFDSGTKALNYQKITKLFGYHLTEPSNAEYLALSLTSNSDIISTYFDGSASDFRNFVAATSQMEVAQLRNSKPTIEYSAALTEDAASEGKLSFAYLDENTINVSNIYIDCSEILSVQNSDGSKPEASWTYYGNTLYPWEGAPQSSFTYDLTLQVNFTNVLSKINVVNEGKFSLTGYYYTSEDDYNKEVNGWLNHENPYGFKVPSYVLYDVVADSSDRNITHTGTANAPTSTTYPYVSYSFTKTTGDSTVETADGSTTITSYIDEDEDLKIRVTALLDGEIDATVLIDYPELTFVLENQPITETPDVTSIQFTNGVSAYRFVSNYVVLNDNRDLKSTDLNDVFTYIQEEDADFYQSLSYLSGRTSGLCYDLTTTFTCDELPSGFSLDANYGTLTYDGTDISELDTFYITVTVSSPWKSGSAQVAIVVTE
ncbi:MAG: hypothetical protein SNG35_07255 [Rikenellaceae bacterium]